MDASTFRPLAENLGVDKNSVYYKQFPQPHIDRASVRVDGLIWRDATHIYYTQAGISKLVRVLGADPETFCYLYPDRAEPTRWAKDAAHYYLKHQPIKVDAASFRVLNKALVADRHHIYRDHDDLPKIAAVSGPIKVVNDSTVRMGNQVITAGSWGHKVLAFDAIERLRPIGPDLLAINGQLYEKGRLLSAWDGDIETLKSWPKNSYYARDARHVYSLRPTITRIEGADRASLAPYSNYELYAADARRVYYRGRVLDEADRPSFEIVHDAKGLRARDKYGAFEMGLRD